MTSWRKWSAETVEDIAATVKARRKELGITAAELADRTSVGKPLTRAVISDIETGRKRTLDITELVTLAAALNMSPLTLLIPNVLEDVEVLPDVTAAGIDVFGWWTGVGGPTRSVRGLFAKDEGLRVASRLADVENVLRLNRRNLQLAERDYSLFERDSDRDRIGRARERVDLLEAERRQLVDAYKKAIEDRSADA